MPNALKPSLVAAIECPNTTNFTLELGLHSGVAPNVSTRAQRIRPIVEVKIRWRGPRIVISGLVRIKKGRLQSAEKVSVKGRKVIKRPSISDRLPV
jgi:hypothetical protein